MFSCEFYEISKNTFSYRAPPVAASVVFSIILCNFDKNKRRHMSLLRFGHKCMVTKEAAVRRCSFDRLFWKCSENFTGKRWWWRPNLLKLHVKSNLFCVLEDWVTFRRLSRFLCNLIRIKLNTTKCSHIKLASSACKKYEYGHFGSWYIKAWFPPVDTFLEIEINTIATFVTRR